MGTGTDGGRQRRRQGRRRQCGGRPLQRKQWDDPPFCLLPSPSPVGRTRRRSMPCVSPLAPVGTADPPPPERRTTCPSLSSPRRLLAACAFRLSFASRSLRWLVVVSPFVTSPSPCVARHHFPFTRRMAPSPLPLSHRRCAVHHCHRCVAVAPSQAPVAR